ncbi:uncharacterized protein PFLUO_LOCUS1295 [Penicillium psychrofluorescens]|uniref:uncharacterized protein n=1 Tax=Penicillium psychrofluorescens TaxID=3158075 RepID=UPI003CCDFB35
MTRFTVVCSLIAAILGLVDHTSASPLELAKRACYDNASDGCTQNSNPFDNPAAGNCLGVLSVVGGAAITPTGGASASVSFNIYDSSGNNVACVSEVPGGSSYTLCSNELQYELEIDDACGVQGASSCSTCSMKYAAWAGDCVSSSAAQETTIGDTGITGGTAYGLAFAC